NTIISGRRWRGRKPEIHLHAKRGQCQQHTADLSRWLAVLDPRYPRLRRIDHLRQSSLRKASARASFLHQEADISGGLDLHASRQKTSDDMRSYIKRINIRSYISVVSR